MERRCTRQRYDRCERRLAKLQGSPGYLCKPFELACVYGKTLAEVGETVGFSNRRGAQGAGRPLVHPILRCIVGELNHRDLAA